MGYSCSLYLDHVYVYEDCMTLDEIVKQHGLPVKVCRPASPVWSNGYYFTLEAKLSNGEYACVNSDNFSITTDGTGCNDWLLYTEPKKKVVMYQAIFQDTETGELFISRGLYRDESHACQTGTQFFRLLTEYPVEVDV